MDARKTVKTSGKTRFQNLVRHKSGRYYARDYSNCKEIWKSLRTTRFPSPRPALHTKYLLSLLFLVNQITHSATCSAQLTSQLQDENEFAPISPPQIVAKLGQLEKDQILKQTYLYATDDVDHIVDEEFYLDLKQNTAKLLHKTIVGNPRELTFDPVASNVRSDFGSLINHKGVFAYNGSSGKWALQVVQTSIPKEYSAILNRVFLESCAPFNSLLSIYHKQYLHYLSLNDTVRADDALNKYISIRNPGTKLTYEHPAKNGTKQEFVFYPNGIVKEMRFITEGKLSGVLKNDFVAAENFDISDSDIAGPLKPDSPLYLELMRQHEAVKPKGKTLGIVFDMSAEGLLIKNVYARSPAFEAGLQPGDLIMKAQGKAIAGLSLTDVKSLMSTDSMTLLVKKNNNTLVTIPLDKVNESDIASETGEFTLAYP